VRSPRSSGSSPTTSDKRSYVTLGIAVVKDEEEFRTRFAEYAYTDVGGAVVYGSDQHVLDGIKAFEAAGADQILLANSVMDGTEQLERVAELLHLR
jgi:alkanesulfonate monooxygenase SsuD/methylene tetrahydromethanopterin reductase-like flavin-dependent oxidoreductase (luciferase family)